MVVKSRAKFPRKWIRYHLFNSRTIFQHQSAHDTALISWAHGTISGRLSESVSFSGAGGSRLRMADRLCRCFLVVFVFYLSFRLSYGVLYSTADHIVLLENDTISSVIHNSPSAWVVEFYSSFCGHCHAFAPTWKKLARMAKGKRR